MYFYNSPYLPRSELCSTFVKSFFLYGAEAPCYICVNIFVVSCALHLSSHFSYTELKLLATFVLIFL